MPLTDKQIKALQPEEKSRKYFDGGGLYLEVSPSGGKWWRLKYRFEGKEKRISLGTYPAVSLKDARSAAIETKNILSQGIDPSAKKKEVAPHDGGKSFKSVAADWIERQSARWSGGHRQTVEYRLERFVHPNIGESQITDIEIPDILEFIRAIENDGHIETASRVLGICSQVFRYAISCGDCKSDPCRDLRGALSAHAETLNGLFGNLGLKLS